MKTALTIIALFIGSVSVLDATTPAAGQTVRQHRLKVAANPAMGYSNATVDAVLRRMTEIARRADFPWDIGCDRVEFVRDGDVLSKSALPLSGTADDLAEAMKTVVPSANVLVVSQITACDGGPAAGCAPLRLDKTDSMAIAHDGSARGAVVWLHERGHVLSLGHVAPGSEPSSVAETISGQLMYWSPSTQSIGLLQPTCNRFRAAFPSAVQVPGPSGVPAAAGNTIAQADTPAQGTIESLLSRSWLHGVPIAELDRLNDTALDQIEQSLAGPVTAATRQLLLALSYRWADREQTLRLLRDHATRAISSTTGQDEAKLEARREQIAAKLGAVFAVGVAGARAADASAAVGVIGELLRPRVAPVSGGLDISQDVRRTALDAAAVVAGRGADQLSDAARDGLARISPILVGESQTAVASGQRLRQEEVRRLSKVRDTVLRIGVSAYLAGTGGR